MKTLNKLLIVLISISLMGASCKKEKNNGPNNSSSNNNNTDNNNNATEKGTLLFHLHTYISDTEVDGYNITYTNEDGRKMSLSLAQFYISDIQLEKLDGTIISVDNKKFIKTLNIGTYEVGSVPAGNYKSVRFKVGLPAATNALQPSAAGGDSTLLKRTEMWLNTTPQPDGYVYLNAQGLIDTSADLSDKMAPFTYKIGTDANYKQVVIKQNFGVTPNTVSYFHMLADFNKLFQGITLTGSNLNISTLSDNSGVLAGDIADNIPLMFVSE